MSIAPLVFVVNRGANGRITTASAVSELTTTMLAAIVSIATSIDRMRCGRDKMADRAMMFMWNVDVFHMRTRTNSLLSGGPEATGSTSRPDRRPWSSRSLSGSSSTPIAVDRRW